MACLVGQAQMAAGPQVRAFPAVEENVGANLVEQTDDGAGDLPGHADPTANARTDCNLARAWEPRVSAQVASLPSEDARPVVPLDQDDV